MRTRIESILEALGHFAYRRAAWIVVGVLAAIIAGALQIPNLELRTSLDDFLPPDDPAKADYDAFLAEFGREDVVMVAVDPPEIFDLDFLGRLQALHEALEDEVPHVHEVQSLVNARETRGEDDALIVGEFLDDWPETEADLAALRERALENPLYVDFLLSREADLTVITIELEAFAAGFDDADAFSGFGDDAAGEGDGDEAPQGGVRLTGQQEAETIAAVDEVVARFDAPDFRIYAGGSPVLNVTMMEALITDIVKFTVLSTAIIALFLIIVFRRALGVLIPLIVALLSVVGTLGLMGTLGIPLMPISEIVPSFLLSIGVGSTVHLIAIFLQRLQEGDDREAAIAGALAHSGLPILMTGLTTAGGLASFATAALRPIAIFGVVAPIGILVCLALTLVLAPALLALIPMRDDELATEPADRLDSPSIRVLTRAGAFATANAGAVLGVCVAMALIAVVGILRLQISFDNLEWFADDMPAKIAANKIDAHIGGMMGLEVLVETDAPNGLKDPELLQSIGRIRQTVQGLQVGEVIAGRSVSLVDVVEEIHQALSGGDPTARAVPDDRILVSQELILFENSGTDDLQDVVDTEFRVGRFSLRVPMADALHYPPFAAAVGEVFDDLLPSGAVARQTGLMTVMGRTFKATIETIGRSYSIALLVITPLMMLLLGSFRLGLIAMIPNLFPILLTLGLMGWTGQPLEMFSLLIGSVALGLAVDDTIHFMHGFRRVFQATGSVETAVRETLQTTGQALLFTSIVLTFGFLVYLFSELNNLTRFGALTAFSVVMAFLADVLLAPALMKITTRWSSLSGDAEGTR